MGIERTKFNRFYNVEANNIDLDGMSANDISVDDISGNDANLNNVSAVDDVFVTLIALTTVAEPEGVV